jgi:hypothetical protein
MVFHCLALLTILHWENQVLVKKLATNTITHSNGNHNASKEDTPSSSGPKAFAHGDDDNYDNCSKDYCSVYPDAYMLSCWYGDYEQLMTCDAYNKLPESCSDVCPTSGNDAACVFKQKEITCGWYLPPSTLGLCDDICVEEKSSDNKTNCNYEGTGLEKTCSYYADLKKLPICAIACSEKPLMDPKHTDATMCNVLGDHMTCGEYSHASSLPLCLDICGQRGVPGSDVVQCAQGWHGSSYRLAWTCETFILNVFNERY